MGSPHTSRLRFLDLSGQPIDGPAEWEPAWIEVEGLREGWESYSVLRNGFGLPLAARLLPGRSRPAIVADWPRSDPGRYRLQLWCGGAREEAADVYVKPGKISEEGYARMVDDLEGRLPASVALGLQRLGAFAGLTLWPPQETTRAQELARLRRAVEGTEDRMGLLRILSELARDPLRALHSVDLWTRSDQARRPHPARLVQAVAREGNLGPRRELWRVVDSRVQGTYDTYENRVVAGYLREVVGRLGRLAGPSSSGQDELARQAHGLRDSLAAPRREAGFLDEVPLPSSAPTRLTMALLKRPPYRAALEGYLELHRSPFVCLEEPALDSPVDNVPHLYQVWGTLQIIDIILSVAAEQGFQLLSQTLVRRAPGELYVRVLPNGATAVRLRHPRAGTRVAVIPERTYGGGAALHSLTYDQRPDLAVEVLAADGQPSLFLFDPKYKLDSESTDGSAASRPVKADLDKMHAYRDAIRDGAGRRPVRYAAILYPGAPEWYPKAGDLPDVEAVRAYPGDEGWLRDRLQTILRTALEPRGRL